MMRFLILPILILNFGCNPLQTITNGETDLDDDFFRGQNNSSLTHDLISFWAFNETGSSDHRYDYNGVNNFTHNIGGINYTSGRFGNAIDCSTIDGSNNLNAITTANMNLGTGSDFTISFWLYMNSFNAGEMLLDFNSVFNITASGSSEITFWFFSNTLSIPVSTGNWIHYAITVDRDTGMNAYVNGNFVGSYAFDSTGNNITNQTLRICSDAAFAATVFNGRLDGLGAWSRMLSSREISDLYYGNTNLD